jgi:DNA-binding FadR family transcriptional regulator
MAAQCTEGAEMTGKIGPEYQRLIGRIRASITSGEYPLGQAIPSTAALAGITGLSVPVVRRAVGQLEADGILEGHPGKGVFVRAMPEEADSERQDIKTLSKQVSALQEQFRELAERMPAAQDGNLVRIAAGLEDLQETVGRIEVNLIDLYGKMGHDYPQGGAQGTKKAAVRRGQAR